jgi:hypothetical protein
MRQATSRRTRPTASRRRPDDASAREPPARAGQPARRDDVARHRHPRGGDAHRRPVADQLARPDLDARGRSADGLHPRLPDAGVLHRRRLLRGDADRATRAGRDAQAPLQARGAALPAVLAAAAGGIGHGADGACARCRARHGGAGPGAAATDAAWAAEAQHHAPVVHLPAVVAGRGHRGDVGAGTASAAGVAPGAGPPAAAGGRLHGGGRWC